MKNPTDRIETMTDKGAIFIIVIFTSLLFLVLINSDPFPDIMEARNMVAARECVEEGNCFLTTMNAKPRVRKPPLPTWVAAAAMAVSGDIQNVYKTRLPNILFLSLTAVFLYLSARHWLARRESLLSALVMVTFGVMSSEARRIIWDVYAVCFAFGGVWMLMKATDKRIKTNILPWLVGACLMWGLSVLSKGPLTIYCVLGPLWAALMISKDRRHYRWWPAIVAGIVGVGLGSSWWAYIYLTRPDIIDSLRGEIGSWTSKHDDGPLYYLLRSPLLLFPWAALLLGSIILPFTKKADGRKTLEGEARSKLLFFIVWLIISFVLLSLAPQKKYRYLMGMLMPASFAVAFLISFIRDRGGVKNISRSIQVLFTIHIILMLVATGASIALCLYAVFVLSTPPYTLISIPVLAALIYICLKRSRTIKQVVTATILMALVASFGVGLSVRDYLDKDPRHDIPATLRVAELTRGRPLYAFKDDIRIVWMTGRSNIVLDMKAAPPELPLLIIIREKDIGKFEKWSEPYGLMTEEFYSFQYRVPYKILEVDKAATLR